MNTAVKYNEQECLQQMAAGREDAFRDIYYRHKERVYRYALYYTHCVFNAEDITQEVFAKVWQKRERIGKIEQFSSYLIVLTRNSCINLLRKNKREPALGYTQTHENNSWLFDVEENLLAKECKKIFEVAVNQLPTKRKMVFNLLAEGLPYNEVAETLDISICTVKRQRQLATDAVRMYVSSKLDLPYCKNKYEAA